MMVRFQAKTWICAVAILVVSCSGPEPTEPARPLVAVSVAPQAYFVEQVSGGLVDVEVMIPPGANPATHEPTVRQMAAISRASLYVKVGHPNFPFENAWLEHLLSDRPGLPVVDGSAGIDRREGDPHVWVSPGCVRVMAANIAKALERILPGEADAVRGNLAGFLHRIDALDADIRSTLAGHRGRKFYVFHPAWGYFAEEYGLEQVSVEEGSVEPTPGVIVRRIREARSDSIRVLFVQPQFSRESAEVIAREIEGSVVAIDPLDRDWPENLSRVAGAIREALAR